MKRSMITRLRLAFETVAILTSFTLTPRRRSRRHTPAWIVGVIILTLSTMTLGQASGHIAGAKASTIGGDTLVVVSTADAGLGSLRQALLDAQTGNTITFDPGVFPPDSPAAITLSSPLPPVDQGTITIDGSNAGVILNGSNLAGVHDRGLEIRSDGNKVFGLQIVNFPFDGILIGAPGNGRDNNTIGGDRSIGDGPLGQGNLISGNGGYGIQVCGDSTNNLIQGNLIGTDLAAVQAVPNMYAGISLQCAPGPVNNTIGGLTPTTRNIISGNQQDGIRLTEGTHHNTVIGNYIGTDASGTASLGNMWSGIALWGAAHHNIIGGATILDRNIISYNGQGVRIQGAGTDNNLIQNNWIGIDADGTGGLDPRDLVVAEDETVFLASYGRGVFKSADQAASWQPANTGLGTTKIEVLAVSPDYAADGTAWAWGEGQLYITTDRGAHWSVKSGALTAGLRALEVSPNYTTDKTLLAAVTNQGIYRSSDSGSNWTKVYDTWAADNFAFSPGFASDRLVLAGLSSTGVLRSTDGGVTWTNSSAGLANIPVYDMAFAADGQDVLLASHKCGVNEGVYRSQDAGQSWTGSGNGLNDCGSAWQIALSPDFATDGIALAKEDQSFYSADGGHTWNHSSGSFGSRGLALAFSPNFAADKVAYLATFAGVFMTTDGGAHWNWAGANLADRGNSGSGVEVCCGAGPTQIFDNVIGGNASQGIAISSVAAEGTVIDKNLVGLGPDGMTRVANGGTNIWLETAYITITDNTSAAGSHGGLRSSQSAHHLTIQGNRFGTDKTGAMAIGNSYDGVTLQSSWDTVRGNVASGNLGAGIWASENMTGTRNSLFVGNLIGVDATGTLAVPNQGYGLAINGSYHTVGGSTPVDRNIISGNLANGLRLFNGAHHITATGNYIGTDITGLSAIPNQASGVAIVQGASNNRIGGVAQGQANLIAYNGGFGVRIADSNTVHNTLTRNSIHSNQWLGIDLAAGGNTELPAPVIAAQDLAGRSASGTACPGCVVELFSDSAGEGRLFEATTTADATGQWSVTKGAPFAGPELTATATDAAGNTSEFGKDWPAATPPAPLIAAPVCGVTNQSRPRFAGMAQLGSTVALTAGATQMGQTTTDEENHWSLMPTVPLADATYQINARATTVHGSSPDATLALTVNSGLCYDPVNITFTQQGMTQHPRNANGCTIPGESMTITLWPSRPVTVSVPLASSAGVAFIEVNSVRHNLEDPDADGVYTASFMAPSGGSLVILLAVGCGAGQQTVQIGSTIDPDGYVYDVEKSRETGTLVPVPGAVVTLNVLDATRNKWILWDAALYGQTNPQVTGPDGYFAFFTPPGQFKVLTAGEALGYLDYASPALTVVDEPIRYNVGLLKPEMLYLPMIDR